MSWLAAAGVRTVCLRSRVPCRSLAAARSLVAICPASLVPLVPSWGVVGRFMGFSDRYLAGVGVSQNMPLNRILWLLVGIFGDVVRCHFSALPVASFSLVCPALRPLSAAASWCRGGHVCAVSWRKRRGVLFRDRGRSPLPASWDGRCWGWFAVPCGWRRRVVVLAFIGSLFPCPLGRGIMCGLRASAPPAVRGSGVSSRFPLSRGSSSCNLAARCHRLSLLASPFCSRRLVIASALPLASVPASCVLVLSLIVPLPVLAISRAGRSLLAHFLFVAALALSSRVPVLACPSWIVFDRSLRSPFSSHAAACPASRLARVLSPSRLFVLPVLRQAWAGSVSARSRCACPCPRRAGGWRCRLDGVGGAGLLLGVSASGGVLCLVCGVGVCIYKWGACSGIIIVVERKRLRRDFRR